MVCACVSKQSVLNGFADVNNALCVNTALDRERRACERPRVASRRPAVAAAGAAADLTPCAASPSRHRVGAATNARPPPNTCKGGEYGEGLQCCWPVND